MQKQCAACGSERIIPLATVKNRGAAVLGSHVVADGEPVIVINTDPRASLGHIVYGRFHAWVCGACGYMPLFADNPEQLYEAYQQFLRATQS